ncbi:MAG: hypothetical protein IKC87_02990 [Clostridia bacterium]|nr:hypothetical protein [Clostridia bacterium]
MTKLDDALLESGNIMRRGYSFLNENMGKIIALVTAVLAVLLTFTDITLPSLITSELTCELIVMLIASYIIYFSLEDAGEGLGKESVEYVKAREKYIAASESITGDMIGELRRFTLEYSERELEYRKRTALLAEGFGEDDLDNYRAGRIKDKKTARALKRIDKMKPVEISPKSLLGEKMRSSGGELNDPTRHKLCVLLLKLLPSTLCMLFTVSMMISAKSGMDAGEIISGIVKLGTLPIIGLKGYSQGYTYAREVLAGWLDTKTKLLDAFLKEHTSTITE